VNNVLVYTPLASSTEFLVLVYIVIFFILAIFYGISAIRLTHILKTQLKDAWKKRLRRFTIKVISSAIFMLLIPIVGILLVSSTSSPAFFLTVWWGLYISLTGQNICQLFLFAEGTRQNISTSTSGVKSRGTDSNTNTNTNNNAIVEA